VTSYAIDRARRVLTGTWSTGSEDVAISAAVHPDQVNDEGALHLARELGSLASVLTTG
jgi:hypothetical protein